MWEEENNKLTKDFQFKNFVLALEFVNKVGSVAEEISHHPEIWFTWGRVIISITTHDAENTVTKKDFELASRIDELIL